MRYDNLSSVKIDEKKKPQNKKTGIIEWNDVRLEPHEEEIAKFLADYGLNIEVIKPTNTPKTKTPDFLINGVLWEAKSPVGSSKSTLPRQFRRSKKQANKVIIDLRRIRIPASYAEREVIYRFEKTRDINQLLVITKDNRLLDIKK